MVGWLDELEKERALKPEECRIKTWLLVNGDNTLRLDYPLKVHSTVYDVGGYEGEWANNIYRKYGSTVEVFEPVEQFYEKIRKKFADNPKVCIHHFGLSDSNRTASIAIDGASSSTHKKGSVVEKIRFIDTNDFISRNGHKKIDLMKINIEGGEYELLRHLIRSGTIKRIDNIQIQFHVFVPRSQQLRQRLQNDLSRTHYLIYNYPWIWESWRRKK